MDVNNDITQPSPLRMLVDASCKLDSLGLHDERDNVRGMVMTVYEAENEIKRLEQSIGQKTYYLTTMIECQANQVLRDLYNTSVQQNCDAIREYRRVIKKTVRKAITLLRNRQDTVGQ